MPATVTEVEPAAPARSSRPIVIGAIAGGGFGCLLGVALATPPSDISQPGLCVMNPAFFGGVVAGTVALAGWLRDAVP